MSRSHAVAKLPICMTISGIYESIHLIMKMLHDRGRATNITHTIANIIGGFSVRYVL